MIQRSVSRSLVGNPAPFALARRLPHHRRQARIAGQRPLVLKPLHIAHLGHYHHRRIRPDSRHRLQKPRPRILLAIRSSARVCSATPRPDDPPRAAMCPPPSAPAALNANPASHTRPRLPNTSVTGFMNPSWCSTACNWFLALARCCPSVIRSRVSNRSCCVPPRSPSTPPAADRPATRCASVSESTRSFFSRADAIAFTRCGCTITSPLRLRLHRPHKRRPETARLHHHLPGPGTCRNHARNALLR